MDFPGVALVTGAASGIGRSTAILFAKEGCTKIVAADLNEKGLQTLKNEIEQTYKNAKVVPVTCDITNEDSVKNMIDTAVAAFSRIDYACNVAGVLMTGASHEFSIDDWDKIFRINVRGTWLCQRFEITQMLKQTPLATLNSDTPSRGSIVNVGSIAGLRPYSILPAYCASKSAVVAMSKTDGLMYAKDGIKVNCVCPGIIGTPMLDAFADGNEQATEAFVSDMAIGRQGRPEEVAEALIWLSSHRTVLMRGTVVCASGGMLGS